MSLTQILGKNLDGESVVSLLNIASISLSAAAANDADAAQFGQVKSIRDALQAQIDTLSTDHTRISSVHVDTVSTTLADALLLADSYADGVYTFGTTVIGEGDSIILQAATVPEDRSWIHSGGEVGDETDFERLNSDIQSLINAGVASVTNALRDGVPEAGDTLNKLFVSIQDTNTELSSVVLDVAANTAAIATLTTEVSGKVRAFYLTGVFAAHDTIANVYQLTLGNPANFENARITVKETLGGGGTRKIPDTTLVETTSDSQIELLTMASSFDGKSVTVIVEA